VRFYNAHEEENPGTNARAVRFRRTVVRFWQCAVTEFNPNYVSDPKLTNFVPQHHPKVNLLFGP